MTEIKDIVDQESFKAWLETQSAETTHIMAMRMGLRTLPIVLSVQSTSSEELTDETKRELIFHAFRASFVSWVAGKYPARDMARAVRAADAAASSAYAAADAADTVAYVTDAADAADAAAFAAADTAADATDTADVWKLIRKDAEILMSANPENWATSPLWLDDVRGDEDYFVNMPQDIRKHIDQFKKSEEFVANHWHLWLDWYTNLLTNPPTSRFGEKTDLEIALKPKEFWDRDATVVMAELAEIVGPGGKEKYNGLVTAQRSGVGRRWTVGDDHFEIVASGTDDDLSVASDPKTIAAHANLIRKIEDFSAFAGLIEEV